MFPFSAEGFTTEKRSTVYRKRNHRRVLVPPKYYRHFWFCRYRQIGYRRKTIYRLPPTKLPSSPIYRRDITGIFGLLPFPSNWLPSKNEIASTVNKTTTKGITVPSEFRLKYRYRTPPWKLQPRICKARGKSCNPGLFMCMFFRRLTV